MRSTSYLMRFNGWFISISFAFDIVPLTHISRTIETDTTCCLTDQWHQSGCITTTTNDSHEDFFSLFHQINIHITTNTFILVVVVVDCCCCHAKTFALSAVMEHLILPEYIIRLLLVLSSFLTSYIMNYYVLRQSLLVLSRLFLHKFRVSCEACEHMVSVAGQVRRTVLDW